ncbi:hypothetical protein M409DRAFT_53997 [Zasmidium cellare ATCC 36951]|uniref:Uncharacterized protein n=1 Tax=Zasmidium cellare ATCC 36951 TaxID=1080233 RepID=A0A6A6CL94_ZASCE|nr:uncharacterized protein M409DRAFT_53997 [Zasmidium cellare ATCC 36951]KAF2167393.1 hypothetical protein M409DRAFT_53997 [Zasmidium cellare ATCC 36951]
MADQVQLRPFQKLYLPFAQTAHDIAQIQTSQPTQALLAHVQEITKGLSDAATVYRNASQRALNSLTAHSTLSKHEVDEVWIGHSTIVDRIQGLIHHLHASRSTMVPDLLYALVDSTQEAREAWALLRAADKLVDLLNSPARIQRLKEETPSQMSIIIAYRKYREEVIATWLEDARRAVTLFNTVDDTEDARADRAWNEATRWWTMKAQMYSQLQETKRDLKPSLRADLDPENPGMSAITAVEDEIDDLMEGMYYTMYEAVEYEPDQEEGLVKVVAWSEHELEKLKTQLGSAVSVVIDTSKKGSPALSPLEDQLLENICSFTMGEIEDPCMLKTCQHVFSYGYVVPWINSANKCAKCRGKADVHNLQLLDVTVPNQYRSSPVEDETSAGASAAED